MKKDIKKIMLTLMMLCMGVVSVGCSGGTDVKSDQVANANKSSANQVDSLKIGVLRTIDSLPIYMADEKNYFTENGVKVELVEFGSASDQSKAIESGAIDGMMTDMVVQHLLRAKRSDSDRGSFCTRATSLIASLVAIVPYVIICATFS